MSHRLSTVGTTIARPATLMYERYFAIAMSSPSGHMPGLRWVIIWPMPLTSVLLARQSAGVIRTKTLLRTSCLAAWDGVFA